MKMISCIFHKKYHSRQIQQSAYKKGEREIADRAEESAG
jgi:hypothetical protein